jgi:hypothetical protein
VLFRSGTSVSISGPITGSVFRTSEATNINRIVIDGLSQKDTIQFLNLSGGLFNLQISGFAMNLDNNYNPFIPSRFTQPPEFRVRSKIRIAPNWNIANYPSLEVYKPTFDSVDNIFLVSSDIGGTDTTRAVIRANGNVLNITGTYSALSDERLKENIQLARPYLSDLMNLEVIKYVLINHPEEELLGFSAQQMQQVFPNMVEEGQDGYLGVKTSVLIPMLVTAVQELNNRVKYLEEKLEEINV